LADRASWAALTLRQHAAADAPTAADATELEEAVSAALDDFSPLAIEDLRMLPLPPGGLWDPTFPAPPDPPPAPLHWRAFFQTPAERDAAGAAIRRRFAQLTVEASDVPDEDWAARSQRDVTAIEAGCFIVAPPWDVPAAIPDGRHLIVIEPSRGFGTGHHASTRLCLRALSALSVTDLRVLDLGTGSGVLAMAASLAGATSVAAIDIDPDAIESARHSASLTRGVHDIAWIVEDFRAAGSQSQTGGPWDLVLANLTGGMLVSAAPALRALVNHGGMLVISGFDEDERPAVEAALAMAVRGALSESSWVGLTLQR
jgi:ribosomal protein L11 methyltransferase